MPDIFISYSRKDAEQATQLAEMLSSAGLSCWIDQHGIEAAASWSAQIVDAINDCKVFVALLSPSSIESHNVIKEISLASEKRKRILPLDLEPVTLPRELEYQLAGIQRAPMTNIDAIIRALGKLGLEATGAPQAPKIVKEESGKKSLMVLPFEDMSPTADNGWFADGLASELINTLSNIKSLKLIDWNTSSMLKNKKVRTVDLAKDFSVRYFIEGQVRKFGDQIKISVTLLDIESGDHLWQDSLRGTMQDIFDIQEQTAQKVVEGLKLHLTSDEQKKLRERGTENTEAYECFVKGCEYLARGTRSDSERALALFEEASRFDPRYTWAYSSIANMSLEMYRTYDRNPAWLERASGAAEQIRRLEGETAQYYSVMSSVALQRDDAAGALWLAQQAVKTDPKFAAGHHALGSASQALGDIADAVAARKEYVRLQENAMTGHFNLLIVLNEFVEASRSPEELASRQADLREAAERAIPVFERHTRLNPDDFNARVVFANLYRYANRIPDALREAEALSRIEALDGVGCYNLACLFLKADALERGLAMLRRAVQKGFRGIEGFRSDPDLAPLRDPASPQHAEFESLMRELETKQSA